MKTIIVTDSPANTGLSRPNNDPLVVPMPVPNGLVSNNQLNTHNVNYNTMNSNVVNASNGSVQEYSNNNHKISYDNPAYVGCINNTAVGMAIPDIIVASDDSANSSGHRPVVTKERTLSMSSVKSVRNVLTPDRRYSRRQSIVQRKIDGHNSGDRLAPPGADGPDGDFNPLRRKMSFIKDTSGEEPIYSAVIQILIASLFAGFGNVGAGVIINIIQNWRVFVDIKSMFVLIPSLLGLKGNLEMTMASRLSTEANMGHMTKWSKTLAMIGGDMALVQCQATVVSFLAAFVAIAIDLIGSHHINWRHSLVLIASSVVTANVACFFLGLVMAFVIVFSNRVNIDPDNVATPIAASLGDVSTAGLFAYISHAFYVDFADSGDTSLPTMAIAGIIVFIILLPVFYLIARRNTFTHNLVHSGWLPVIVAMIISSGGGFFLDSAVDRYDRLPPFQPVICGVGGNLVAVAASKLSTRLHMNWKLGLLPFGVRRVTLPHKVFFNNKDLSTKLCLMLFLMAIPLHLLYSLVIWGIQSDRITLTFPLILLYIGFATLQVLILLVIGYNLIHMLWSFGINPDMSAIPLLTALGDLLGSAFLLVCFGLLQTIGDPNAITPSSPALIGTNITDDHIFNDTVITTTITTILNKVLLTNSTII